MYFIGHIYSVQWNVFSACKPSPRSSAQPQRSGRGPTPDSGLILWSGDWLEIDLIPMFPCAAITVCLILKRPSGNGLFNQSQLDIPSHPADAGNSLLEFSLPGAHRGLGGVREPYRPADTKPGEAAGPKPLPCSYRILSPLRSRGEPRTGEGDSWLCCPDSDEHSTQRRKHRLLTF